MDKTVAVHYAVSGESGVLKAGDHRKDPPLLGKGEMGLEAHHIVQAPRGVVPAKLHHGIGPRARDGMLKSHGFKRAEAHRVLSPGRHHLNRHTALEYHVRLKIPLLHALRAAQRVPETQVLLPRHGAIDIVGRTLSVAGGKIGGVHVDALIRNDWGRRVEKAERAAEPVRNIRGKRGQGERACRNHAGTAVRNAIQPRRYNRYVRVRPDLLRHKRGECCAVDGERAAGRHARSVRALHDQRAQQPHLLFEQTHRIFHSGGAQGVGADKLGEIRAVMGGRHLQRLALDKLRLYARLCDLPCGLAAGEACADHLNRHFSSSLPSHSRSLRRDSVSFRRGGSRGTGFCRTWDRRPPAAYPRS